MSSKKIIVGVISLAIVGLSVFGAKMLATQKPERKMQKLEASALLVDALTPDLGDFPIQISATALVEPSREVTLMSQVSGKVVWEHPEFDSGFRVMSGEKLIGIDPTDYQLALDAAQADLMAAQADLDIEMGQQDLARQEYDLLSKNNAFNVDSSYLALRGPQLQQAQAALKVALNTVETAKVDLSRTTINAPFNALILEPLVRSGSVISANQELATLVDTSAFYLKATVAASALPWITKGGAENDVEVTANGQTYQGRVYQIVSQLDSQSRLVPVYIRVENPLDYDVPLLLGDYVTLQISGKELSNAFRIPRNAVRPGNVLWYIENGTLQVHDLSPTYSDRKYVYVRAEDDPALKGMSIITSPVATMIEGMLVTTETEKKSSASDAVNKPQAEGEVENDR